MSRRSFVSALTAAGLGSVTLGQAIADEAGKSGFHQNERVFKASPFPLTQVRLNEGPFHQAQQLNLAVLRRLPMDRLVHNFRINAGLPSAAQPLGGWEKPDCELRGHFTGHYLSACAFAFASTGDLQLKTNGDAVVAALAVCQKTLGAGYLSAFPGDFFDRLNARTKVWAPFYTYHKIMAGMLDMHRHCGNAQALDVACGMADWTAQWTAPIADAHMQEILKTEYGGMNEVLYNLYAVTGKEVYAQTGDRFSKRSFFDPLALRLDELNGLHVNTHIPQVIGAARRYELSDDERYRNIADYFWSEVTSARAYVTGGTSNNEAWMAPPNRLSEELTKSTSTAECCCAYNMLKLTRHLYKWTADPRYMDYYERTLWNHRLGAMDPKSGGKPYYYSLTPNAWKTFGTEYDSFWCCTGTGVEEFAKLNDSIYAQDREGLFVNLFIASEVYWPERGVRLRQDTRFPDESFTRLTVQAHQPISFALRLRVPWWLKVGGSIKVNGKALETFANPGSYVTITRAWREGDTVEMALPLSLHSENLPGDPNIQAFLYGPLVLAGLVGNAGVTEEATVGPMGPSLEKKPEPIPNLFVTDGEAVSSLKPSEAALTFHSGQQTFMPLYQLFGRRYSVYWRVSS